MNSNQEEKYDSRLELIEPLHEEIEKLSQQDWCFISSKLDLPESFIRKYQGKVDWRLITSYQKLSEDFMDEFQDRLDWGMVFVKQECSEPFINNYREMLDEYRWSNLDYTKDYTDRFIISNCDKIRWDKFTNSKCEDWDKDFIYKYSNEIVWSILISKRTDLLDLDFLMRYKKHIDFKAIDCSKLDKEVVYYYKDKVDVKGYLEGLFKRPKKKTTTDRGC